MKYLDNAKYAVGSSFLTVHALHMQHTPIVTSAVFMFSVTVSLVSEPFLFSIAFAKVQGNMLAKPSTITVY